MTDCSGACPTCPRKYRPLPGDGPQPTRILIIPERPGQNENRFGRVMVGKTGQELDQTYLPLAGLSRPMVRIQNVVKCWADNNRTPSEKEVRECGSYHLPTEIAQTDPEFIMLLGGSACRLCPGVSLERHHGIPQHTSKVGELFGWSGWVIPMFHPALGLHESRWMTQLLEDWEGLRDVVGAGANGHFPADPPERQTDYRVARSTYDISEYLQSTDPSGLLGVDTESHSGRPWSVQISGKPNTGILVRADNPIIEGLDFWLNGYFDHELVFHNAGHDVGELARMGISPPRRYRDTMQEAFHLGNLPQGLKSLAYRLFRHEMTSWEDIVRPDSIDVLSGWLCEAQAVAQADLPYYEVKEYKTCACGHGERRHTPACGSKACACARYRPRREEIAKPGVLESLLTRLIRLTTPASEYDPWERLDDFWHEPANEWMSAHVEARCGGYPRLGIGNCSIERAVQYAVGDADLTAQVAVELARRRTGAFEIYDGDRDR